MVTGIFQSFTYKMAAKTSWHRYGTKLRHWVTLCIRLEHGHVAGFMLPAVCLIATGYVNCNASLAVFLIVAAVGLSGISLAGFMVNHLDLAPLYAGIHVVMILVKRFITRAPVGLAE